MKYLIIPIIILCFKTSFTQEGDSTQRFARAYLNANINFSSEYKLNAILEKNDLSLIPQAAVGVGSQMMIVKNWLGLHLIVDVNLNSSSNEKLRSSQQHYAARIGPAFKVALKKRSTLLFLPYYSYSMIETGIYYYHNVPLSEEVFEDKIGNAISLERDSHALGFRLSWETFIGEREFLFSAGYSYDLLPSRYEGIGINESSSFPSEQLQYFQLSIGVKAF